MDWQKSDLQYTEMVSTLLKEFGGVISNEQKSRLYELEIKYNTLKPISIGGAIETIGNGINGLINIVESFFK